MTNHSLTVIRTLAGYKYRPIGGMYRRPFTDDTPLAYVERMIRVEWRIRDAVGHHSHTEARQHILALAPVRRLLRDERRRALAAADRFADVVGTSIEAAE